MAACEWFLMFWMFIDAALAYSLTKFAKRCQLEIPCLLCSRLNPFGKNDEEPGPCSYLHLFCNKHQQNISYLIYCNLHNELVDAREMCEDCFGSVTLQSQSNLGCYRPSCLCCTVHCDEKSIGKRSMMSDSDVSRVCKATAKPPLPRRHGRSRRARNKMKHRRRDLSKFTSDSESENLLSDVDDRYKVFGKHSYSTPDLGSYGQSSRTTRTRIRSASLTPNSFIRKNKKGKKPLSSRASTCYSTDGYGSMDGSLVAYSSGSQNRYNIFSRNSFSASDLGSAVFLEMVYNKNLPRRSVSLTPKSSSGYGLGKHQKNKNVPPKAKKNTKSDNIRSGLATSYGYGYLDDSVISRKTGTHHHNENKIPRRHSYSVIQLGGDILLNMPVDESLTPPQLFVPNDEKDYIFGSSADFISDLTGAYIDRNKGYGSLDDSALSRRTGIQYQSLIPRRHSHSFFELGCEFLLNTPFDEGLTSHSAPFTPYGSTNYGVAEPPNLQVPHQRGKRNKKPLQSPDDSFVLRNTGGYTSNNNPRRHSYSAFELGSALQNLPPFEETANSCASLTKQLPPMMSSHTNPRRHSYSAFELGSALLNLPPFDETEYSSASFTQPFYDMNRGYGSLDDSVVSRKTVGHDHTHNNIPRRHSYSVFQLGGDILLNMPNDESLTSSQLFTPRDFIGHHSGHPPKPTFQRGQKNKNSLPPMSSGRSDIPIEKRKWHGSFDDYLVSRGTGSQNLNNNRRHSSNTFDLDRALLVEINLDKDKSNGSSGNGLGEQNRPHQKVKRQKNHLPPPVPTHDFGTSSSDARSDLYAIRSLDDSVILHNTRSHIPDNNPRRHSYSAYELGCALLLNMQRDGSLARRSGSGTPDIQKVIESQIVTESHPTMDFITSDLPPPLLYKPRGFGSFDDSFLLQSRKPSTNLTRSYYSASDLTSLDESSMMKSASLAQNCSVQQGLNEFNGLKFQSGPSSSLQKRKKNDRSKAKKNKKPLPPGNNAKVASSPNVCLDDDSDIRNRYKIFSQNSQSASDLGSLLLVEMQHDNTSRARSKSLTPNCYFRSPEPNKKPQENKRASLCPSCLDKIDLRSLDGISISEFDGDGCIERVKRQAEDDVRCMRLLQSELEAERNAATIAANHAMTMITRLQQEKAALQMEALQYLRMMEEQAEYDMEALQKANELVEEKENEIQDLLDEIEQYRNKYENDELINTIKGFHDEKKYVLEALSTLESKIHQLSNGVHGKSQGNESHVDLVTLELEIKDLKEKMEALRVDIDLLQHACYTLHGSEGLEFVQEIAHQLQDLRGVMVDRRISTN
ncbi:zein-binding domain-containing protein [Artemisia annua]|uniref:Zein-binding domain-containing protein n=1 Tax=Artemisia annua TaxID=35608 RepID=A0A2U1N1P5_ARTAN|nr:zein-binding domain-containing protein [Artemisia annua]